MRRNYSTVLLSSIGLWGSAILWNGAPQAAAQALAPPDPSKDVPVLIFVPEAIESSFQQGPFNFLPDGLAPIFLRDEPSLNSLLVQAASGLRGRWHVFPSPVMAMRLDRWLAATAPAVSPREGRWGRHREPPPAYPASAVAVERGPLRVPRVALTFDACSGIRRPSLDADVQSVLTRMEVPATIFVSGSWAERAPGLVRELAENPLFEIGNHSYSHPHLTRLNDERLMEEIQWTQDVLFRLTGKTPRLFRAPFGEVDDRLVRGAALLGLRTIQFDVESGDPDPHVTRDRMISWVVRKSKSGSIVVMHINRKGRHTAEALPDIIRALRSRGFELVKVSDLLQG